MVGWAAQNALNMDKIDSLFRNNSSTAFNPTWGATVTPPTLGTSGFTEGRYFRLFPRMVVFYFRLYCGTASFVAGSGSYTLTLPVAVDPDFVAINFTHSIPLGKMIFYDDNAVLTSTIIGLQYFPPSNVLVGRPSNGGSWTNALPAIPANNDRYSGFVIYPTAVV